MKPFSILAIYILFWSLALFVVLPFGMRTPDEAGTEKRPGQADSAPANWQPRKIVIRTTIVSAIFFAIFYANYVFGWLGPAAFDPYSHFVK